MDYKEKLEFVEKLGWKHKGTWANRNIYALRDEEKTFHLIEHNGSWSIPKGEDLYYIDDAKAAEIAEYTAIIKEYYDISDDDDKHTLREFREAAQNFKDFYSWAHKRAVSR